MILGRRTKQRVATLERNLELAEAALRRNGFIPALVVSTEGDSVGAVSYWSPSVQFMSEQTVARDKELRGRVGEAEAIARRKTLAAVILALELDDYIDPHDPTATLAGTPLVEEFWSDVQTTLAARAEERKLDAQDAAVRRIEALARRTDESEPASAGSERSWVDAHIAIFSSASLEDAVDEGVKP